MADTPFLGPTYNLTSRPASTQRTVNLMPVPLEPGNERAGWVFKDVPGLVDTATTIAPSQYVDCDLLLHYDRALPATWKDYSIHRRALNLVPNTGSILSDSVGKYGTAAGKFVQTYPGQGSAHFNTYAHLTAAGNIDFLAAEFFIGAWVSLDALPVTGGPIAAMAIWGSNYGYGGGVYNSVCLFQITAASGSSATLSFGATFDGGTGTPTSSVSTNAGSLTTTGSLVFVSVNRKNGPTQDDIYFHVNGVAFGGATIAKGSSIIPGGAGLSRVAATDYATAGTTQVVSGYHGTMEELYVNHGPGCGISVNYTVPTIPFDSTHTLRQILGLDP